MFRTLKRIIKSGLKTFWRNGFLSSSSILTLTITLVISAMLFFGIVVGQKKIESIEKKVDINIYFTTDAPLDKVLDFKKELNKIDGIDLKNTKLLTKEEALKDFKDKNNNDKSLLEALEIIGENPLGPVLNIKTKDLDSYNHIIKFLESDIIQAKYLNIIEKTNYNENKLIIKKIKVFIKYIELLGMVISGVMIFISLIIVYNTIRLIIYSYKEEIQVMRLIGASNFFARGPFLVEGILYGFISGIFALFISWSIIFYSKDILAQISNMDLNRYFSDHILEIAGSLILGGIVISFISTYFTVARYLKIKEEE